MTLASPLPMTMVPGHGKGCPCDDCATAKRAYEKRHALWTMKHGPRLRPVAGPVQDRLREWVRVGFTVDHINAVTGLDPRQISRIVSGSQATLTAEYHAAVLSITPSVLNAPDGVLVPAFGAGRRVEALLALGYPRVVLEDALHGRVNLYTIRTALRMQPTTWFAVDGVYREREHTYGPSEISRRRAARAGYAMPASWDDIDDWNERPKGRIFTRSETPDLVPA